MIALQLSQCILEIPAISWATGHIWAIDLKQGLASFFYNRPDSTYFRFAGIRISVTTTQVFCNSIKAGIDNLQMNGCGHILIKLYLQKQAVALGPQFANPCSRPWTSAPRKWKTGRILSSPVNIHLAGQLATVEGGKFSPTINQAPHLHLCSGRRQPTAEWVESLPEFIDNLGFQWGCKWGYWKFVVAVV